MYILNITAPTKDGDIYKEVSLNLKPIVWTDDLEELYSQPEFQEAVKNIVKQRTIYEKSYIQWREITDDMELAQEGKDKLSEKIKIDL